MSAKQQQQGKSDNDGRQQGGQKTSQQHSGQRQEGHQQAQQGGQQQAEAPAGQPVPNPVQMQKFLGGLDYPVKRADLIERARAGGADENTLGALLRIPDREYDSPVSVSKEVGDLD